MSYPAPKARLIVVDGSVAIRTLFSSVCAESDQVELVASLTAVEDLLNVLKRQPPNDLKPDLIAIDIDVLTESAERTLAATRLLAPSADIVFTAAVETQEADIGRLGHGQVEIVRKILPATNPELAKKYVQELVARAAGKLTVKSVTPGSFASLAASGPAGYAATTKSVDFTLRKMPTLFLPKAIAIASSTGGPKALYTIFSALKGKTLTIPVFITQHMPEDFTGLLAKQIGAVSGFVAVEGTDGMVVQRGGIYIAPGNHHMQAAKVDDQVVIRLNQEPHENFCRPAADPMIRSLVDIYGAGLLLVVITGMGQDGLKGAEYLVEKNGVVIAQDQTSSVVWGMPGAVATRGLCSGVYPIDDIANAMIQLSAGRIA